VTTKLLSTNQEHFASKPSRENLLVALGQMAKQAKSHDVLVIYLAGHGINLGGQDGDYFYLTMEARTQELTDPAIRGSCTLSSQELTDAIKAIPANKQVLILDTCAAGGAVKKLTGQRSVPSSQVRALARLSDRAGMHILAGCAADAVS